MNTYDFNLIPPPFFLDDMLNERDKDDEKLIKSLFSEWAWVDQSIQDEARKQTILYVKEQRKLGIKLKDFQIDDLEYDFSETLEKQHKPKFVQLIELMKSSSEQYDTNFRQTLKYLLDQNADWLPTQVAYYLINFVNYKEAVNATVDFVNLHKDEPMAAFLEQKRPKSLPTNSIMEHNIKRLYKAIYWLDIDAVVANLTPDCIQYIKQTWYDPLPLLLTAISQNQEQYNVWGDLTDIPYDKSKAEYIFNLIQRTFQN